MSANTYDWFYFTLLCIAVVKEFEVAGTSNPLQINQVLQILFKSIRRELTTIIVYWLGCWIIFVYFVLIKKEILISILSSVYGIDSIAHMNLKQDRSRKVHKVCFASRLHIVSDVFLTIQSPVAMAEWYRHWSCIPEVSGSIPGRGRAHFFFFIYRRQSSYNVICVFKIPIV